jgi:hypothetical protein
MEMPLRGRTRCAAGRRRRARRDDHFDIVTMCRDRLFSAAAHAQRAADSLAGLQGKTNEQAAA